MGGIAVAGTLGKMGYDAYQRAQQVKNMAGAMKVDPRNFDAASDQYQNQYQGLGAVASQRAYGDQALANSKMTGIAGQNYAGTQSTQRLYDGAGQQQVADGNGGLSAAYGRYANLADSIGQGPSVAQAQLQQGLNAGLAAQQSQAASATGGGYNAASAQRAAMMNGATMAMNTNAQAGQLRAQEVLNNQQAQAQAIGGMGSMGNALASQGMAAQQLGEQRDQYDRSQSATEANQLGQLAQGWAGQQQQAVGNAYAAAQNKVQMQNQIIQQNNAMLAARAGQQLAMGQQQSAQMNSAIGMGLGAASGIAQAYATKK